MTAQPDAPLPLPGLEDVDSSRRHVGDVESGVRRTIAALAELEQLEEKDAGRLAIAVSLARIIATKESSGRLSTVSNDARLLVELLDSFAGDEGDESDVDAKLRNAMEEWSEFADRHDPQAAGP